MRELPARALQMFADLQFWRLQLKELSRAPVAQRGFVVGFGVLLALFVLNSKFLKVSKC